MSTTINHLASLNGFELNPQGVFQTVGAATDFDYSDGASSELALHQILSQAEDLSSDSAELQAKINDWPSEYHLSVTRANLLRTLNLDGVKRVLELGCGCGSITRYLGEQAGIKVDAVEGSPARAALARLRCSELDNVEISAANFNDIDLPESEYDLVLFVGVTEYAGRFSTADTDQAALNELLSMGKRAVKKGGVVLVAIENRLGLKYALGASEDHYGVPYVGLDSYPQSTGIRTYSRDEWLEHIEAVGFQQHRLLLPFPDYKVPTAVLRDDCDADMASHMFGGSLLGIESRDYTQAFMVGESLATSEGRTWQALAQAGTLADHSNSFLWLLGDDATRIEAMAAKPVSTFLKPTQPYDLPRSKDNAMRPQDAKMIEHLNARITQLKSHSSNLEDKVDLMSNSIGWRFLNLIRRLFRKTTI